MMDARTKICLLGLVVWSSASNSATRETFSQKGGEEAANICSSSDCEAAANVILQNVDFTADPCENFYKYACGNFIRNANLSNSESQKDQFTIAFDRVIKQIKKVIEDEADQQKSKTFDLIENYYQSCINVSEIEARGFNPLKKFIKYLGGWPVLSGDSWKEEDFSWEKLDRLLNRKPENIFHLYSMKDIRNSSRNILYLSQPGKENNEYLQYGFNDNRTLGYYNYMVNVAVLLGANRERALNELKDALSFEIQLKNARMYAENFTIEMYVDRVTIQQLQELHTFVPWLEYINSVTYPRGNFSKNDKIHIDDPLYLQAVKNILAVSTKRTVANYMIWKAISNSLDYLNDDIHNEKVHFSNILNGKSQREPRKEECLKKMIVNNDGLLVGISAIYVSKYFSSSKREKANEVMNEIQNHYNNVLQKSTWLDEDTKREALKKSERMKKVIGYPDEITDMKVVDEYYEDLQFHPNNYFENAMKLKNFSYQKSIENFWRSPNETFWLDAGVAAYISVIYNLLHNAMILPASILQSPIFNEHQPNYLNYGALGFLIGHEMTHAFELSNFQFDDKGSLRTWYTENDIPEYQVKSSCFISQYDNFSASAPNVSHGTVTIGENIADVVGIQIAFEAYKRFVDLHGKEQQLSKLNQTNEQLFWISAASILCTARTQQREKYLLETDDHSREEFRVIGAMSNSVDFARSFNCPNNTLMNPGLRCSLW